MIRTGAEMLVVFSVIGLIGVAAATRELKGICWKSNLKGKCSRIFQIDITKADCCSVPNTDPKYAYTIMSWSSSDTAFEKQVFWWFAFRGGSPACDACETSCRKVRCPEGRKCKMRHGVPKCACDPPCSRRLRNKGPVCGSDGVTYKNVCRLRRIMCRTSTVYDPKNFSAQHMTLYDFAGFQDALGIAYLGACKNSCSDVTCPGSRKCIMDQTLTPHCMECASIQCPKYEQAGGVCGADGVSYPSVCHLRNAACDRGYAVPLAHHGPCTSDTNCSEMACGPERQCLNEPDTDRPRCMSCGDSVGDASTPWLARIDCDPKRRHRNRKQDHPVCATNGQTYDSWCEMRDFGCANALALDAVHRGKCGNDTDLSPIFRLKHLPAPHQLVIHFQRDRYRHPDDVPGRIKWTRLRP